MNFVVAQRTVMMMMIIYSALNSPRGCDMNNDLLPLPCRKLTFTWLPLALPTDRPGCISNTVQTCLEGFVVCFGNFAPQIEAHPADWEDLSSLKFKTVGGKKNNGTLSWSTENLLFGYSDISHNSHFSRLFPQQEQ